MTIENVQQFLELSSRPSISENCHVVGRMLGDPQPYLARR